MQHINFPPIPLKAILIGDKNSGGFSAFFAQFPEAMAQGSNQDEAMKNLVEIFTVMLLDKSQEGNKVIESAGFDYIEKPFNLVLNES